jgi:RNA polymerase sigma factor (sigma-70 family)
MQLSKLDNLAPLNSMVWKRKVCSTSSAITPLASSKGLTKVLPESYRGPTPIESQPSIDPRIRFSVLASMTTPPDDPNPEELFRENLPLIEQIIGHCCRRAHFSPQEAEDFGGSVRLKLVEDDYRVFREFLGRSSIKTYLTVTIKRLLLDYQNHIWGKWRPSAEAERLGRVAMRMERLLVRDELSFDEVCKILRGEGVEMTVLELADLRAKLPPRTLRRFVSEERLQTEITREPRPDERLEGKERAGFRRRVFALVLQALKILTWEEQVLVRMRTEFKVSEIARTRGMEQKPLYKRLEKIYEKLRKELERHGIRRKDIEDLLGGLQLDDEDDSS